MEPPYSEKDIGTAPMIFKRAVEYFKIPDEPPLETVKDFIHEDGTIDLSNAEQGARSTVNVHLAA